MTQNCPAWMCSFMQFTSKSWKFESKTSNCINPYGIGDACDYDYLKSIILGCSKTFIFLGGRGVGGASDDDYLKSIVSSYNILLIFLKGGGAMSACDDDHFQIVV